MAKRGRKQKLAWKGSVLTMSYASIGKAFSVDVSKYSEEIQLAALQHGFKQKFGDAKSGESAAEKFATVQRIHAALLAGDWKLEHTAPDLTPIICEAIARIQGEPLDKVQAAAAKAGEEQVKIWGTKPKVRAEILKIRAERAAEEAEGDEEEIDIDLE